MKIIRLTAENVKRLKAVEIEPDGTMQVITGRNAQGKTSVLDAIWLALGGGTAARGTPRVIRDGEEQASVTLDLGDLTVTRTWKGEKTTLTVTSPDGARYSGPQGVLDALVGRLSFDPLAFTNLSTREQREALLDLVDIDVDLAELATQRKRVFDDRTEAGRQEKALGASPDPDPSLPAEEISAGALIDQIEEATSAAHVQQRLRHQVETLEQQVKHLQESLTLAQADLAESIAELEAQPIPSDVAGLRVQLEQIEDTNRRIRDNASLRQKATLRGRRRAEYAALTDQIAALDQAKADALAKAAFPVPGLGFDDEGVTYQGVPFAQASSAEQIRVSLAMAMSLNPKLRVIRILDGSLLDAENLALISEMAADSDYQIWVERVSDASGVGVVIEDGLVSA